MIGQRADCCCRICRTRADRSALERLMLDLPITVPERVDLALGVLNRTRSAYRILTTGGSAAALGLALKRKTMALIRHDRILRCEVHQ